jgi:hypothetical protein
MGTMGIVLLLAGGAAAQNNRGLPRSSRSDSLKAEPAPLRYSREMRLQAARRAEPRVTEPVRTRAERELDSQRLREQTRDLRLSTRLKNCLLDMAVAATKVTASAIVNDQRLDAERALAGGFSACLKSTAAAAPPELGPYRLVAERLTGAVITSAGVLADPLQSSAAVAPLPWPLSRSEEDELGAVLVRHAD